jgi:dTDP-glucose pyrophosphorylase
MYERYDLKISIMIYYAPYFLAEDVAMIDLLDGIGDRNNSKYTKEEFIKEIEGGNVLVAMLRDDPIAYAVINKDKEIEEMYISYSFKDTKLKECFENFVRNFV